MPEGFQRWDAVTARGEDRYAVQSQLIREVLALPTRELNELLARMRASGESCVYLCGSRLDNDFGFGSADLGLALSVLPEDGPKAAVPAYHPGSTELYVTIKGELVLEWLESGVVRSRPCSQHEVAIISPGQCHRVRHRPDAEAASLIVKTGLDQIPAVVRCAECKRYRAPTDCPLHAAWVAERSGAPG
jgi:hypothetical protein